MILPDQGLRNPAKADEVALAIPAILDDTQIVTMLWCQLLRPREYKKPEGIGDPVIFDIDIGAGGTCTVHGVMTTLMGQSSWRQVDITEFRLEVRDGAGEWVGTYGVSGEQAEIVSMPSYLEEVSDEVLIAELQQRLRARYSQ